MLASVSNEFNFNSLHGNEWNDYPTRLVSNLGRSIMTHAIIPAWILGFLWLQSQGEMLSKRPIVTFALSHVAFHWKGTCTIHSLRAFMHGLKLGPSRRSE